MLGGVTEITAERMTGLGAISGIALKLLFLASHLKASQKEAEFAPGVQRLFNLFKSLLCTINESLKPSRNLAIKPKFTYFLPKNEAEELDNLIKGKNAGLLSDETSVIKNPLIEDGQAEFDKIKAEKEEKAKLIPAIVPPVNIDNQNLKIV